MKTALLMPPTRFGAPRWFVALYFGGIPLFCLLARGGGAGLAIAWLIGLTLAYYGTPLRVLMLIPFVKQTERRMVQEGAERFKSFIGRPAEYCDVLPDIRNGQASAAGIALANGNVYLMENGKAICLPWDRVRSWSWQIPGYDRIISSPPGLDGTAMAAEMRHEQANMEAAGAARNASGFFVEVASIEDPVWQILSTDENLLRKWMEIFNQLNEGLLPGGTSKQLETPAAV